MDNNNYNGYPYSVQRPEGVQQAPPQKKRVSKAGIAALLVAAFILCGTGGGVGGYFLATHLNQSYSDRTDPGGQVTPHSTASPTAVPNENTPGSTPAQPMVQSGNRTALTLPEIYDKCNPAVVAISTEMARNNAFGYQSTYASAGSGFITSSDGTVITNHHVIEGADTINVLMPDGKSYKATVVGSDASVDIAVLKIEASGLPFLTFGDSDEMRVGDTVAAIGNPLGEFANSQTSGTISALSREVNIEGTPLTVLQTDAAVSPGNSGGPLINVYGEVIGIVSAKSVDTGVEGIGFAIPSNSAAVSIASLAQYGYIKGRASLGVTVNLEYSAYASRYRQPEGVYVESVSPGSAADKAGLQEGDIIFGIGDTEVTDFSALQSALLGFKPGEKSTIRFYREGGEQSSEITFDERTN
ncbi:MAG: trypsin-like peptidase domain-containing protein [Oscillospiraceae bacterium]|nr:trypsin-like peptidase domain-containing protein [Oscillospiraceae bacterium]